MFFLRTAGNVCLPRSGARMAVPQEGSDSAGTSRLATPRAPALHNREASLPLKLPPSPLPLAKPQHLDWIPGINPIRRLYRRAGGLNTENSPLRSSPPAQPVGPRPQHPPAPPPLALPASRKRRSLRLGLGKGPLPEDTARWVLLEACPRATAGAAVTDPR